MNRYAREQLKGVVTAHTVGKPPGTPSRVVLAKSEEEFNKAVAAAPGAVVADFGMEGCGACEESAPELDKLVAECNDVTVVRVDVDDAPELADKFKVEAMPTFFYADKAALMVPGTAKELEDVKEVRRTIKCARVKK